MRNFSKQTNKKINKITTVLLFVGIGMSVVLVIILLSISSKKNQAISITSSPQPSFTFTKEAEVTLQPRESELKKDETNLKTLGYLLPYKQQNDDLVGWLKINNTQVDYPVVYSGDNEYYLTYNFDKEQSEEGAIFLDFRCNIYNLYQTRNIILYGHRMKDGRMFKSLVNYKDSHFFINNPTIRFDLLYKECEWEVFSVFETTTDFYYIDTYFPTDEKWLSFTNSCYQKSMHKKYVELKEDDVVLTLSTCTSKKSGRFVVMARLIH